MNPDNYIHIAEKLVEAVLQMQQLVDRLITAHDDHKYWSEQHRDDKDPF